MLPTLPSDSAGSGPLDRFFGRSPRGLQDFSAFPEGGSGPGVTLACACELLAAHRPVDNQHRCHLLAFEAGWLL